MTGFVPQAFAYELLENVSGTAVGFTAATYAPTNGPQPAVAALITTDEDQDKVRFRIDGGVPTSRVGHEFIGGSSMLICQAALPRFKVIKSGTADVDVRVTYFDAGGVP